MSDVSASAPPPGSPPPSPEVPHEQGHGKLLPLAIGALGIVYGDIGTSPLYALKECFARGADGLPTPHASRSGMIPCSASSRSSSGR